MKKISFLVAIILFCFAYSGEAQDVTTVEAKDSDISENLDLEAVASVFGEAENLEDFEKKLNDPEKQISNLDLNEDGEVDYLRVLETSKGNTHLVTIQAVIGEDQFQDVATIDVVKEDEEVTSVQVVGDVYMYGPDYVVTPVYVHPPVIFVWFWGPLYSPWRSPFYWGYYPPYYHPWRPYPPHRYRTNVRVNVNVNNSYNYTSVRRSKTAVDLQKDSRRNDFGAKHPDRSFEKRNEGVKNRSDLKNGNRSGLEEKRAAEAKDVSRPSEVKKSTGREVQKDWKPQSESDGNRSKVKNDKVSVPKEKVNKRPETKPTKNKAITPANKPARTPVQKPKRTPQRSPKRK